MTFSFWDWVIVIVALAQLAGFAWLGYALYRLKKGPVDGFVVKGSRIVLRASLLGTRGIQVFTSNYARGVGLVTQVRGIGEGVRYGTRTDFGDRISYKSLLATVATLQTTLGTATAALGVLRGIGSKIGGRGKSPVRQTAGAGRGRAAAPPGPVRRTLLDRMGLVPPIAKPLGKAWQYAPLVMEFYREFRRRIR